MIGVAGAIPGLKGKDSDSYKRGRLSLPFFLRLASGAAPAVRARTRSAARGAGSGDMLGNVFAAFVIYLRDG